MSHVTSVLKNIISNFLPSYDMPKMGDLVRCFSPYHFDDNEILIGNRDFLAYNKTSVPYVEHEGRIYCADTLEALPSEASGELGSCRKYILAEGETSKTVGEKLVYSFD